MPIELIEPGKTSGKQGRILKNIDTYTIPIWRPYILLAFS